MMAITDNEIKFLQRMISNPNAEILDVMCGYGRLGNRMYDSGYQKVSGVDMGTFDFIPEKKKFNCYNADFYSWIPPYLYDYCYSLYNSYDSYESFLKTIERCKLLLNENGILIIDIFNKHWRDRISDTSYRIVSDEPNEKLELFRSYDGLNEKFYKSMGFTEEQMKYRNDRLITMYQIFSNYLNSQESSVFLPMENMYERENIFSENGTCTMYLKLKK